MAVRYEYYDVTDGELPPMGDTWYAQTFTTTISYNITSVRLEMSNPYGATGTLTVGIRNTLEGIPIEGDLCSGGIDIEILNESAAYVEISFSSSILLDSDTQYAIVVRSTATSPPVFWSTNSGTYEGGDRVASSDGGSNWDIHSGYDCSFETWGEGAEVVSYKLVPDRPDDYDPDAMWDEDTQSWVTIGQSGGERYQTNFIAIGQGSTGNGVIYYEEI